MFNVDDYANQPLADAYGIVMGTSHTGLFIPKEKKPTMAYKLI